ncbi:MAG: hypothetical protein PHN84_11890 [Desulfuromonadaceae bacterium]|nr:hypothetical protein [Desulfuromonadaceae bacterium]MDD2855890.1 hypothetical protein [Desulfuromonadaceae bacterium]
MSRRFTLILFFLALAAALLFDFTRLNSYNNSLAFEEGVADYRTGKYRVALENFTAVNSAGDSLLLHRVRYNEGNCFARLAEESAAINSVEAVRLYNNALKRYQDALNHLPGDPDTLYNQSSVKEAMADLLADQNKNGAGNKLSGAPLSSSNSGLKLKLNETADAVEKNNQSADFKKDGKSGSKKTMGLEQAERLLNKKRGKVLLPSAIKTLPGGSMQELPEKDW